MIDNATIVKQAYAAFNQRNIDAALSLMTEDVSWPKASEGGKVVGKQEIRAYWLRQWAEFDPHVEPLVMTQATDAKLHVQVHQLVRDLQGNVLFDGQVTHIFTMRDGLIAAMDLADSTTPTAAFTHHKQ